MDAETIRLLITALVGLGGVSIGVLSAQKVATRTLEGQRRMAIDEAVRKWRLEDVRPLLDGIAQRQSLYQRLGTQRFGAKLLPHAQEEAERLIAELAATPDWNIYAGPLLNVAPDAMRAGLNLLQTTEDQAHALLVRELGQRPATTDDLPRLLQVGEQFSAARATIRDAAETYVTDPRQQYPIAIVTTRGRR